VWGLAQTVAPADEPVTRDEAMLFCRADNPEEAPLFDGLIRAARRRVERGSSRQLVTATWQLTLDSFFDLEPRSRWTLQAVPGQEDLIPQLRGIGIFSAGNVIRLPKSPLRSVVSVQYVDTGGNPQTLDPSRYLTDLVGQPGRIAPAYGTFWPITRRQINAVTVTFTAGYADAGKDCPDDVKLAVKQIVALKYQNRSLTDNNPALEKAIDSVIFQFWDGA